MSTKDVIDARPETISTLMTFSSTPETIVVPTYQRLYQWDTSKIVDLLHLTDPDGQDFGFVGTMVFVKNESGSLEVVDGQQRLLSITLILCALRDYIRSYVDINQEWDPGACGQLSDLADDIQRENLLVTKTYSKIQDKPRIVFHRKSYETFNHIFLLGEKDYISEEQIPKAEIDSFSKNYSEAVRYLDEKYSTRKPSEVVVLLDKRIEKLKGLVVNAIYITSPDYAGEVFESINGTGIILKLSELVKNYLFRTSSNVAQAQTSWEKIESNSDNKTVNIESIIKYDWQNRLDETRDFEFFRSIKANTRGETTAYLNRIVHVSKIFHFYLHPTIDTFSNLKITDNRNDKNHIIRLASVLRLLDVKQFLRLLIAVDTVREYIKIGDYLKLLKLIHNFQVRAKVSGIQTNEMDRLYSRYGKKVQTIGDGSGGKRLDPKQVSKEITNMLFVDLPRDMAKLSSDEAFVAGFINYRRTKTTQKDFFKYMLGLIESSMQRQELVIDIKDNTITLEEIYPQQPSDDWVASDLDAEDIYKFGNATILTGPDNGAGSNKAVIDKLPIYKTSNLKINSHLVNIINGHDNTWSKSLIVQRSKELSEIAVKIWHL